MRKFIRVHNGYRPIAVSTEMLRLVETYERGESSECVTEIGIRFKYADNSIVEINFKDPKTIKILEEEAEGEGIAIKDMDNYVLKRIRNIHVQQYYEIMSILTHLEEK